MPLPSSAHAAVQRETKRLRNASARANRVRVSGVQVLRATDATGQPVVLAVSAKEPDRAYVLRQNPAGAWTCSCFVNRWQHRCAHVEAVEMEAGTA